MASVKDARVATELAYRAILAADPIYQEMIAGNNLWGDIVPEVAAVFDAAAEAAHWAANRTMAKQAYVDEQMTAESAIWNQPFSANLSIYWSDTYDLRALSDADYEACMTWLYDQGWEIEGESRDGVKAIPADLMPRVWTPPPAETRDASGLAPAAPMRQNRQAAGVKRFCRTTACSDARCRYVHGDTIPRINEPCGFGAGCGASDPVKRSQCLRMHPGETWTPDMVITRPA
jgi:hypothetical protein